MEQGKLKVVAISDIHGYLPKKKDMPEGDVLCIAGDILPLEYQRFDVQSIAWFLQDFTPWADKLPYEEVLVVFGNHDFVFENMGLGRKYRGTDITNKLYLSHKHKVKVLCDNSVIINDFRFYGTSWIPDLKNWAFYKDHEGLTDRFSYIPNKCDVLISHCPPRIGTAGVVLEDGWNLGRDFGCQELADALQTKQVDWVLCGHVHSGSHDVIDDGMHKIVNVSLKNEDYKVTYEPFVFELTK